MRAVPLPLLLSAAGRVRDSLEPPWSYRELCPGLAFMLAEVSLGGVRRQGAHPPPVPAPPPITLLNMLGHPFPLALGPVPPIYWGPICNNQVTL